MWGGRGVASHDAEQLADGAALEDRQAASGHVPAAGVTSKNGCTGNQSTADSVDVIGHCGRCQVCDGYARQWRTDRADCDPLASRRPPICTTGERQYRRTPRPSVLAFSVSGVSNEVVGGGGRTSQSSGALAADC